MADEVTVEGLTTENARLKRQLDKAIEVLGTPDCDVCPNAFNLPEINCVDEEDICPKCWREALVNIE